MYISIKISAKPSAVITILFLSLPMQTISEYEEYGWYEYEYFDYDVVNKTLVYMDIWSQTLHNITIKAEPSQATVSFFHPYNSIFLYPSYFSLSNLAQSSYNG